MRFKEEVAAREVVAEVARRHEDEIDVVVETAPLGTAGALANAAPALDPVFFLANGDSFFGFNWLALVPALERDDWTMHLALATGVAGGRYGRVETREP